jgi:hypothetical protein
MACTDNLVKTRNKSSVCVGKYNLSLVALLKEYSAKFCPVTAALLRFRVSSLISLHFLDCSIRPRKSGHITKNMEFFVLLLPIFFKLVNINFITIITTIIKIIIRVAVQKCGFLKMGLFFKYFTQGNEKVDPWKYEVKVVWRCIYLFQNMDKLLTTWR